ncbi:hypothetical protein K449DRAFT_437938 [Hypoxylon sp. EC38]|nr:hypothetical protein K449DRAFT_437938 [Hypoxylon sp. EC38]
MSTYHILQTAIILAVGIFTRGFPYRESRDFSLLAQSAPVVLTGEQTSKKRKKAITVKDPQCGTQSEATITHRPSRPWPN